MKSKAIFYLMIGLFFWVQKSNAQDGSLNYHRVTITSSSITINGETNVNKFHCTLDQTTINDSIIVKNIWSNQTLEFEGLRLIYQVDDFKCSVGAMNKDFQELLKSDQYPYLVLQLKSIILHPGNNEFERLDVDAEVDILLAGIKKTILIKGGEVLNHSEAHLTLKGDKNLMMTDFEIEPPTKFLGIVKVTDDIQIEFSISMEVSSI